MGEEVSAGQGLLAKRACGPMAKPGAASARTPLTVGGLERALLAAFPAEDAEPWDRTGLSVGDPSCVVSRVAVALDATPSAVRHAKAAGANVLVTHHPAFLDPPASFMPVSQAAASPGAVVWHAVAEGVAVMSFHTAFDASVAGGNVLPALLGLQSESVLVPLEASAGSRARSSASGSVGKGYGRICRVQAGADALTLGQLAARCTAVFGRPPRVWGPYSRSLGRIVTSGGSAGSFLGDCLASGADCLVCGEVKYHDALAYSEAGLCIVELGHDVSELPLVAPLATAVEAAGVEKGDIVVIDQSGNWSCPEAVRM